MQRHVVAAERVGKDTFYGATQFVDHNAIHGQIGEILVESDTDVAKFVLRFYAIHPQTSRILVGRYVFKNKTVDEERQRVVKRRIDGCRSRCGCLFGRRGFSLFTAAAGGAFFRSGARSASLAAAAFACCFEFGDTYSSPYEEG